MSSNREYIFFREYLFFHRIENLQFFFLQYIYLQFETNKKNDSQFLGPTLNWETEFIVNFHNFPLKLLFQTLQPIGQKVPTYTQKLTHFIPPFQHLLSERLTSFGIMGEPWVPPLNPSETIVLSRFSRF